MDLQPSFDRPLRVLVVAPALPPVIGGAETIAEVLVLGLCAAGLEVSLLTADEPRPVVVDAVRAAGGNLRLVGASTERTDGFVGWEWATFQRAMAVHRLIEEKAVDVVHAMSHDASVACAIALAGKRKRAVPLVATYSEMSTENSDFGRARSRFTYGLPVQGFLHLSEYYRKVAAQYLQHEPYELVAAAVDVGRFTQGQAAEGRRFLGVRPDRLLLLCASRYSERKGQADLLDAMHMLPPETAERVTLVLAGSINSASSSFLARLQQQASTSPVEVTFVEIDRDHVADCYAAADLMVLPSHHEGLGFSAIEAMAAGTCVILTDTSGFSEVHDQSGQAVVVPVKNPEVLAKEISQLLADPTLRGSIAESGRRRALLAFGPQRLTAAALELYTVCLADTAASDPKGPNVTHDGDPQER